MIDIHCHLLPGIDDGPDTLEQAVELARLASRNGITHSVLTPHIHPGRYDNTAKTINESVNQFRNALKKNSIPLQLGFAAEVRLSLEMLDLVKRNAIPFYGKVKGFKVLLLELPHSHVPPGSDKLISWLLDHGIRPMIAHPERNKGIMADFDKIKPFIEVGCFVQLTAGSVAGMFGEQARECAQHLLKLGCVTVLASDAHNIQHRPPRLDHGRDAAANIVGKEMARRLVYDHPKALVRSQFTDLQVKQN